MNEELPEYVVHNEKEISGFCGPCRFLSNFWYAPVEWKGITFESVEVAYQASKCQNPREFKEFSGLNSFEAKSKGKKVTRRADFEEVKLSIMEHLVFQKFNQYPMLLECLKETRNKQLIEANHWRDRFWGVHFCRREKGPKHWDNLGGENHLGKILMKVRNILN